MNLASAAHKTEALRACGFLAGMPDELLQALAARCRVLTVGPDRAVVTQGEAGSTMYVIIGGEVRVHDGEVTLARLGEGEVFGEMAVLDAEVRSATVTTSSDATLLELERDSLFDALATHPGGFQAILHAVLQRERGIVHDVKTRTEQVLAYEKELEIGRRIQAGFLPDALPTAEHWQIASCFEAAREVAGDFYDAFELPGSGRLALVLGDVCDKGVGAALFMTLFRSLIRAASLYGFVDPRIDADTAGRAGASREQDTLVNTLVTTNRYIATTHASSSMFASVFFGILDPASGRLDYVNAGHEAPIVFRSDGECLMLEVTGGVVGLFAAAPYRAAHVMLQPGDMLLAFTDGVNEAKNAAGDQFSEQRLLELENVRALTPDELLQHILGQVRAFRGEAPQSDDISMLALKFLGV